MKHGPAFKMSTNNRCLAEGFTERFKTLHKHKFQLIGDAFHPAPAEREYVRVGSAGQEWWADAVTGALYDVQTGQCATNGSRIKL